MNTKIYEPGDLVKLMELLQRVRPKEWLNDYPGMVDLHEILAQHEPRMRTRLWLDEEGQLAAFALVDTYNNLLCEIALQFDLGDEVAAWGETCLRQMRRQGLAEAQATLDASCRMDDARRMQLLLGHGFKLLPGSSLHYRFTSRLTTPLPALPPGYHLTDAAALASQPDLLERIVALHRAAFGSDHMTLEERQSIMSTPEYDAALDLFIAAPGGQLVGYCTCTVDSQTEGVGYTDPIVVHPDFQRQGLGKFLLLTGLDELHKRGVREVRFGTSSDNVSMRALAESTGFEVYEHIAWFAKTVQDSELESSG